MANDEDGGSVRKSFLPSRAEPPRVEAPTEPMLTAADLLGCGVGESALAAACADWTVALGAERVERDKDALLRLARTTLPSAPLPAAILRPVTTRQVSLAVAIASYHRVPVYPISRGKNWGWGDACPVGEGQVVLDLSGMNRILELDMDVGYAVVEPGVTQGQLAGLLAELDAPFVVDCAASGPRASLLGNLVERGFGNSPQGERFYHLAGMEVVLADGRVVGLGYCHYAQSRVSHVQRWGVGPSLDGLFSQSNFGIVTKVGMALVPRPPAFTVPFFSTTDENFERLADTLTRLRLNRILPGTVHVLLARDRDDEPSWTGFGGMYGSTRVLAAQKEELLAALSPFCRVTFADPDALAEAGATERILREVHLPVQPESEELLWAAASFFSGISHEFSAEFMLNWVGGVDIQRPARPPVTPDPVENDYGLYFLMPTCKATGAEVRALHRIVKPIFERYGFPPLSHANFLNGRMVVLVSWLVYDRKDAEERLRARACYRELHAATMAAGYMPYRMGIETMDMLDDGQDAFWDLARTLKATLDPHGIIAPGRYIFPSRVRHRDVGSGMPAHDSVGAVEGAVV